MAKFSRQSEPHLFYYLDLLDPPRIWNIFTHLLTSFPFWGRPFSFAVYVSKGHLVVENELIKWHLVVKNELILRLIQLKPQEVATVLLLTSHISCIYVQDYIFCTRLHFLHKEVCNLTKSTIGITKLSLCRYCMRHWNGQILNAHD